MKPTLVALGTFALRLALGAVATLALVSDTHPMHRRMIRLELESEEHYGR